MYSYPFSRLVASSAFAWLIQESRGTTFFKKDNLWLLFLSDCVSSRGVLRRINNSAFPDLRIWLTLFFGQMVMQAFILLDLVYLLLTVSYRWAQDCGFGLLLCCCLIQTAFWTSCFAFRGLGIQRKIKQNQKSKQRNHTNEQINNEMHDVFCMELAAVKFIN